MLGAVAVILVLVGAGLIHRGVQGVRVGADLRCPNDACNYPLRDIADAHASRGEWTLGAHHLPERRGFPVTCPECGRVVASAKDAARGERRSSPGLALLGAGLMLAAAVVFGYVWMAARNTAQPPAWLNNMP